MSTKTERQLRKNEEALSKFSRFGLFNNKKQNFDLLSSSSTFKSDIGADRRVRRRKIRSTQDFNHLSSSSLESDESTKPKMKKINKNKVLYSSPRISHVDEDSSAKTVQPSDNIFDEHMPKRKGRKKSRKQSDDKNDGSPAQRNKNLVTKLMSNQCMEKRQSGDEYRSAHSASDSNRDSEVEIRTKNKRQKKKIRNTTSIDDEVFDIQTNTVDGYAKRIKKLLSDEAVRKTRSNNRSNSNSRVSTPVSCKKSEGRSSYKKRSLKQIDKQTPKAEVDTGNNSPAGHSDMTHTNMTGKRSILMRLSHQDTPHPKMKLHFSSYDTLTEQPRNMRNSEINLSEDLLSTSTTVKINKKSSTLTEYVSFDMDFESDDVFVNALETQIDNNVGNSFKPQETMNNNVTIKTRKSVRFRSPEQNVRRETLVLQNLTPHGASNKSLLNECKNDISQTSEVGASTSGSSKRNSTFEIASPKVINLTNSSLNISQKAHSDSNTSYEHSTVNLSRQSINNSKKRKSSADLFSPVQAYLGKSVVESDVSVENAVNDLTTTPLNGIETEISGLKELDTANETILQVLHKGITFSEYDKNDSKLSQNDKNNSSVRNTLPSLNTSKLIRTATFTMEDETVKQASDLPQDVNYCSPLHTSYTKPLDTSKVNKRRRWDKSQLSVSFLDNSVDIRNISAPWLEHELNKSSNNSSVNISQQNSEGGYHPSVNDARVNKISINNRRSPPSASSTPFPKGKTNLLREALLRDKQDVVTNGNSKVKEKPAPHKFVSTKIPNFALIHQRALDKMENIKEMSERKAARAKLLLSGHKPPSGTVRKSSSNRKELKFSPTQLKKTPLSENKTVNRSLNKSNISVTKISKISPSKSNPKAVNKENRTTVIEKKKALSKLKSHIPVASKVPNAVTAEKKGFTRFGFKVRTEGVKAATKDEQVKAVAAKSKIMKNTLEERRIVIKGVRSNRRFELLMQKRNK